MDKEKLKSSKKILIIHLTDIQPSKIKFGNERGTLMEEWGKLPYLLKKGTATIKIRNTGLKKPRLYAVDSSGKRVFEVSLSKEQDIIKISIDNHSGKTGITSYELVEE